MDNAYTIKLTAADLQQLGVALSRPYGEVTGLIPAIQSQVTEQDQLAAQAQAAAQALHQSQAADATDVPQVNRGAPGVTVDE